MSKASDGRGDPATMLREGAKKQEAYAAKRAARSAALLAAGGWKPPPIRQAHAERERSGRPKGDQKS